MAGRLEWSVVATTPAVAAMTTATAKRIRSARFTPTMLLLSL
jgi:hypothetical protein